MRDDEGVERRRKAYSVIDGIYTQQGTNEIKAMFGDGKTFSFPKPSELVKTLLELASDKDSLILDSFSGSGTTGQAVLDLNKQDDGGRQFILIEIEEAVARDVTAQRLTRVIEKNARDNGGGGASSSALSAAGSKRRLSLLLAG